MSNQKFYEAVLREALPISREYADKGWPSLLYPWFLAHMQLPDADKPAKKAFTLHMGDGIRAGALAAVSQRIPWFIADEIIEPHVTAQEFAAWLEREDIEPSQLVNEWFKHQGVGSAAKAESKADRNSRWLAVYDEENRKGPVRGAQARAVRRIMDSDGVTDATAKKGIQSAEQGRSDTYRTGGVRPLKPGKTGAHNVFSDAKPKGRAAR